MEVGDLIRPKQEENFKEMGYAIITKHDGGDVVYVWVNDGSDVYVRWYQLEQYMELA